jgi:hypothetical protein
VPGWPFKQPFPAGTLGTLYRPDTHAKLHGPLGSAVDGRLRGIAKVYLILIALQNVALHSTASHKAVISRDEAGVDTEAIEKSRPWECLSMCSNKGNGALRTQGNL